MTAESPGRVLVVDDDPAVRDTMDALLGDEFAVELAADGDAAAAAIEERDFDVVITDFEMPSISGVEVLQRAHQRRPYIVGILVTGHAELPEVRVAMHMRGGDLVYHLVTKPYDPDNLIGWVRTAARSARLRRATMELSRGRPD